MVNMSEKADVKTLTALSKIVRRVDLVAEIVDILSAGEFFANYLARCDVLQNKKSEYLSILMIDTISKFCFTREMIPMCKTLYDIITGGGENVDSAIRLAIDLCVYKKCQDRFTSMKIGEYLTTNFRSLSCQKMAKHLIRLTTPN